jgi:excisionase family DNA binding protein
VKQNLLTVGTVARELGVSRVRVHQLLADGRFPSAFQLDGGQWLIDQKDLATNRVRNPGRPKTKKGK